MAAVPAGPRRAANPSSWCGSRPSSTPPTGYSVRATLAELPDGSLARRLRRSGSRLAGAAALPVPRGPGAPGWTHHERRAALRLDRRGGRLRRRHPGLRARRHCRPRRTVFSRSPSRTPAAPRRVSMGSPAPRHDPAEVSVARLPFVAGAGCGGVPGHFFAPVSPSGRRPPGAPRHWSSSATADRPVRSKRGSTRSVQFFTSRGLAVAGVDYRGSTGYGRAYRERLVAEWGVADVDDCATFARALAAAGLVDGDRMAIRGTSAGGLTALGALVRTRALPRGRRPGTGSPTSSPSPSDTHDFESRYLDSLVGPLARGRTAATGSARRSTTPDRVTGQVLLLQGADDPVVPADQSVRFAEMLREHGVECRLVVFDGRVARLPLGRDDRGVPHRGARLLPVAVPPVTRTSPRPLRGPVVPSIVPNDGRPATSDPADTGAVDPRRRNPGR